VHATRWSGSFFTGGIDGAIVHCMCRNLDRCASRGVTPGLIRETPLTDVVDRQTRSRMMAGIRGRDTKPEMVVRSYLHAAGLRFRLHDRRLPGRPDIVLPRYRTVVLVHGCFWHRHPGCRFATTPSSHTDFWSLKFTQNVQRDAAKSKALESAEWNVLTIWECETREVTLLDELFWRIVSGPHHSS